MDLRQLRYFLAVAEELNFTRAAARLHMAQSPLSQQIRALERDLAVALFARTKRRVELTPAGELLVGEARAIARRVDEARILVRRAHQGLLGRITVGFTSSATYDVLPDMLARFRQTNPEVAVALREGVLSPDQLRAIGEGSQDLGFLRPPIRNPRIDSLVLRRERLVVVLPEGHAATRHARVDLGALASERFVMYPQAIGAALNDPVLALCQQAGFVPDVVQEVGEMQTIVRLVAAGMGIAVLPASAGLLQVGGVAMRPLRQRGLDLELVLAWHRDNIAAPVLAFIALARAAAQDRQPGRARPSQKPRVRLETSIILDK